MTIMKPATTNSTRCIGSTLDRDGYLTPAESTGKPDFTGPLEVLIDRGTKHSTEILAAALQQKAGAKLIGERSYGAVRVQGMTRLADGSAVSISIARWLPPDGVVLNKGIKPDIEVKLTPSDWQAGKGPWWIEPQGQYGKRAPTDGKDIQLEKALDIMRNSK